MELNTLRLIENKDLFGHVIKEGLLLSKIVAGIFLFKKKNWMLIKL